MITNTPLVVIKRFFFCLYQKAKFALRFLLCVLIFPQNCLLCGVKTFGKPLCEDCFDQTLGNVAHMNKEHCAKCGKELISEVNLCVSCRINPICIDIESVFPLYAYRFWAKDLLFSWKTMGDRSLSPIFAEYLYRAWRKHFYGIPLVPVPARPGKIRTKGWDQIEELVAYLEYCYHVPVMRLLERTGRKQQKKLGRTERLQNNPFLLKKNARKKLTSRAVFTAVILDDIMTTGATLENCARELKEAGVQTVYALTLFIVE